MLSQHRSKNTFKLTRTQLGTEQKVHSALTPGLRDPALTPHSRPTRRGLTLQRCASFIHSEFSPTASKTKEVKKGAPKRKVGDGLKCSADDNHATLAGSQGTESLQSSRPRAERVPGRLGRFCQPLQADGDIHPPVGGAHGQSALEVGSGRSCRHQGRRTAGGREPWRKEGS